MPVHNNMYNRKCDYCSKSHTSNECPIEKKLAPFMKKIVGMYMENFISKEVCCPRCNCKTLNSLNTNAPSLDIICTNCRTKFEVKSKCMSSKIIPKDLIFHHGNYYNYINRQKNGLDFFLVIYSVCRKTKIIVIKNILYAPNEIINSNDIKIEQKHDSHLSEIIIPDYNRLPQITLSEIYAYDFSDNVNAILNIAKKLFD